MTIVLGDLAGWAAALVSGLAAWYARRSANRAGEQVEEARRSADAARDSAETMREQLTVAEEALADGRAQRQESERTDSLKVMQEALRLGHDVSLAAHRMIESMEGQDFPDRASRDGYRDAAATLRRDLPASWRHLHRDPIAQDLHALGDTVKALDDVAGVFLSASGRPPDDRSRSEIRDRWEELARTLEDLEASVDAWSSGSTEMGG